MNTEVLKKDFKECLHSFNDDDFRIAFMLVNRCRTFVKFGCSVDEILCDNLYYSCRRFVEEYDQSLNGI